MVPSPGDWARMNEVAIMVLLDEFYQQALHARRSFRRAAAVDRARRKSRGRKGGADARGRDVRAVLRGGDEGGEARAGLCLLHKRDEDAGAQHHAGVVLAACLRGPAGRARSPRALAVRPRPGDLHRAHAVDPHDRHAIPHRRRIPRWKRTGSRPSPRTQTQPVFAHRPPRRRGSSSPQTRWPPRAPWWEISWCSRGVSLGPRGERIPASLRKLDCNLF
jgi:hypothetical protein